MEDFEQFQADIRLAFPVPLPESVFTKELYCDAEVFQFKHGEMEAQKFLENTRIGFVAGSWRVANAVAEAYGMSLCEALENLAFETEMAG